MKKNASNRRLTGNRVTIETRDSSLIEEEKKVEQTRQPRNIMIRRTPRPISSREIEESDR